MADVQKWVTAGKDDIRRLGGSFMKSPEARQAAAELGAPRFGYYFRGRGSVLGPVTPDVVAAVFGFFPTGFVRDHWNHWSGPVPAPGEFAHRYVEACRAWGRRCLAGFDSAERLADLLELVVDRADVPGTPLFAGWRAVPRPDDAPARVAQLAHLLREHRGGLHLTAVLARGLSPVEAVLTRDNGVGRAEFLGWRAPHPTIDARTYACRASAEELTDRLAAPAYAVLTPSQLDELGRLLDDACTLAMARHRSTAARARLTPA